MSRATIQQILVSAFERKKALHSGYSQRTLARDLGVSGAFVTNMLQGTKLPPLRRYDAICRVLELDVQERRTLEKALHFARGSTAIEPGFLRDKNGDESKKRETLPLTRSDLIEKWYNLAVLEGLSLVAPMNSPESLRNRLGLSSYEWNLAIKKLRESGIIEDKDGQLSKKKAHAYIPTGRSRQQVRKFHKQMINKGLEELDKTEEQDFHRRLISGFTFAANPQHLERLKEKVLELLDEMTREAAEGDCTEVYQFNVQLFPLTSNTEDEPST